MGSIADLLEASLWPIAGTIAGIFIGAFLQYRVSLATEKDKALREVRTQAYVDFIRGCAGLAISQVAPAKLLEYTILLTDAKARITIYGSKEIVASIANFFREGEGKLQTAEQRKLYLAICKQMRQEGFPNEAAEQTDIAQLLFGQDL